MRSDLVSWRFLRRAGTVALHRNADVAVTGREHVPHEGPVIVAARHYHHLYDGCVLLSAIDRSAHIVVGLDWITNRFARAAMNRLCTLARWPVVLRPHHPDRGTRAVRADDRKAILRKSARDVTVLLGMERIVIVFPEGYPNVDPGFTPKHGEEMLPFVPGYLRFATIAQRSGVGPITVVPAGLAYVGRDTDRWRITVRFGEPHVLYPGGNIVEIADAIESAVIGLSAAPAGDSASAR